MQENKKLGTKVHSVYLTLSSQISIRLNNYLTQVIMGEEEEGEESGEKEPNFVFLVGSPYIIPKSEKLTLEI